MVDFLARARKAVAAGVGAGLAAYTQAAVKGNLTLADWELVVGAVLVVGVATFWIPNKA